MLYKEYVNCRRDYQELGSLLLLERKHACLYYKPGLGKTYPCIDAMLEVNKSMGGKAKILILSTANAIKNMWNAEIVPQKILPEDTVLMSLSSAIVEQTKLKLMKVNWDVIVIDECHKIKSHSTKSSKLVYMLSKKTEYVWGLSGTPRGNSDLDIYCQFHNMCISDWGQITYTNFVNTCCEIDRKFFGGQMITVPTGILPKYRAGWDRNIAMYTQRMDYKDALDYEDEDEIPSLNYEEEYEMPPLNVHINKLPYVPTKEYINAELGVISIPSYESTMTKLTAIQKLHQAVNGFLYVTYNNCEGRRSVYQIEYNKKLDWLKENVGFDRCVIVYKFEMDKNSIMENLNYSITESVEEFKKGDCQVLLLQCSQCESFNLQICHRIIFYTMDYSYINYNQMLHRLWRLEQKSPVDVDILVFDNTVETKILQSVLNKEKLSQLFMNIKGV